MKKVTSLLMVAASLAVAPAHSYTTHRAEAFTVTPSVSYVNFSDKRNINDATFPTISVGYNFSSQWGIEGTFGSVQSGLKSPYSGKARTRLYLVDGLYYFAPYEMFSPYLSFGTGVLYSNSKTSNAVSGSPNSANLNVGLGAEFFHSNSVSLRAEAKDLYTIAKSKNDFMFSLGVSFSFGGNAQVDSVKVEHANYKGE